MKDAVEAAPLSKATGNCLECHSTLHPGIVEAWKKSRHAATTPEEAIKVRGLGLKVSGKEIPEALRKTAVGCAECHTMRPKDHGESFDHNDHQVHTAVSPGDCSVCHSEEAEQYSKNLMSHAYGNLFYNKLYNQLEKSILAGFKRDGGILSLDTASTSASEEGCYHCHGTLLRVTGKEKRNHKEYGEMEFPMISGWPNQGVGRVNLDGTKGSCSSCHTRHLFSIETARKPYTCKQCHVGPDVPAFKVYEASKHGNLFSTHAKAWDFTKVPWTVGRDFSAPTCASCHVSLLVNTDGEVVTGRTHQMNDRLPWRMFGLIYAHPHPKEADTTSIRTQDGLPLPTDLEGNPAQDYLIGRSEIEKRKEAIQAVCLSCHGSSTVRGQWGRFEDTIRETNSKVLSATRILADIWAAGHAAGPSKGGSPFDEEPERIWADSWLIYANTIRFASAMGFGGDYGVFADGRYELNKAIVRLQSWLDLRKGLPAAR
jgi:hypothetical protein